MWSSYGTTSYGYTFCGSTYFDSTYFDSTYYDFRAPKELVTICDPVASEFYCGFSSTLVYLGASVRVRSRLVARLAADYYLIPRPRPLQRSTLTTGQSERRI